MLEQEHFFWDRIYQITTIVGKVYENAIEEILFVGYTRERKNAPQKIIYEYGNPYDNDYYITDNNHRLFDTKEQAQQFIGFYNNGKEFIKIKGEN